MPASALQVGNLDTLGIAALSSHTCNDDRSNRVRRRFHIQDSILMSCDPLRITRRGPGAAVLSMSWRNGFKLGVGGVNVQFGVERSDSERKETE